jgi:hypothetical protein
MPSASGLRAIEVPFSAGWSISAPAAPSAPPCEASSRDTPSGDA